MIDLRKSIFSTDFNNSVSSIRQYLQISHVNRLIKIIDKKSNYDLISRSNAHYNLVWLKNNLNSNLGNLSTKQHRNYLIYIIESATEI